MVSYRKWRQPLGRRRSAYYWQTRAKLFRAPEGRWKLAGGGAKRNHRYKLKKIVRVPAGTPDRNSQQDQSRSGALSGRVVLSWRFRWLRFAPPPANFPRASGAGGVSIEVLDEIERIWFGVCRLRFGGMLFPSWA